MIGEQMNRSKVASKWLQLEALMEWEEGDGVKK